MTRRPGLLAAAVPSFLSPPPDAKAQTQSPIPMSLGSFLTAPTAPRFNEKDERGAGWENTQPSSSSSSFTLLLVPFAQSLSGPPALTHPTLSARVGGKFCCNKLGVRLVSILHFSGIIPSDLMCKFLSILYFFVFYCRYV